METEEEFVNASYESNEGKTRSESEGTGTSSGSEGPRTYTASEGGESPSKSTGGRNRDSRWRTKNAAQKECVPPIAADKVPLTAYEAFRLVNIERNNKKLEDLGLSALEYEVGGAVKADATRVGVVNLIRIPKPQF